MGATSKPLPSASAADRQEHLHIVAEALGQMRYGVIQLTVHDGKLTQVDVTERRRFA